MSIIFDMPVKYQRVIGMQLSASTGTIDCFITDCVIINRPRGATKLPCGHLKAPKLPLGCYFLKHHESRSEDPLHWGLPGLFQQLLLFLAEASFTLVT